MDKSYPSKQSFSWIEDNEGCFVNTSDQCEHLENHQKWLFSIKSLKVNI